MGELLQGRWTATQPWRGILASLICFAVAFGIASAFKMYPASASYLPWTAGGPADFMHLFTAWSISMVPILVIMGVAWGGKYPAERLEQPWKGFAGLAFMFAIGTLGCFWVLKFVGGGMVSPIVNVFIICVVIVTFFLVIGFGCWPWHKMSLPAKGFLTLISAYLIMLALFRLWNFDVFAGSPVAGIAPSGPIGWANALSFFFWMVVFLFVFVHLGMWPIHKVKGLMTQPALGITLVISCFALAFAAYAIGVWGMNLEPIYFMLVGISYAFGMLMLLFMFQMWPGRTWKGPAGSLVNLLLAVVIAIAAFYGIRQFCIGIFGATNMYYPHNWFAMANVMLALTFPMWAAHEALFDYWPLPPPPAH